MLVAKSVAVALAVLLIVSGVYQLFLVTPRPSTLSVALVVSGVGILYHRSWGYYIGYLAAFSCLLPPQRISLLPVNNSVRHFFRMSAGLEPEVIYALLSVVISGVLGWTHYALRRAGRLDRPMSLNSSRTTVAALAVCLALVFIPALNVTYQLIIDPPGPGGPAVPAGGLRALMALYRLWPFVLAGLVGATVCLATRKHRNTGGGDD